MKIITNTLPMLKIRKIENPREALGAIRELYRHGTGRLISEVKLDGIACDLTYAKGMLWCATIRRDSNDVHLGYDITDVVRGLQCTPESIPTTETVVVRGVLVLPISSIMTHWSEFDTPNVTKLCVQQALYNEDHKCHYDIRFIMADYLSTDTKDGKFPNMAEVAREFTNVGGCSNYNLRTITDLDFRNIISRVNAVKLSNKYDTCGVVFKIGNMFSSLEGGSSYYDNMIYLAESRVTSHASVMDQSWLVTKSSKITPFLTVHEKNGPQYNCNLHNMLNLERCAQFIGDEILIDRRGGSQPIVRGVWKSNPSGKRLVTKLIACPECGVEVHQDGHTAYCTNKDCHGILESWIRYCLNRAIMNIRQPHSNLISQMVDMVQKSRWPMPIALFKIDAFDISIELYESINRYRTLPLRMAMAMLNIPMLSTISMKNIAIGHKSLYSIFTHLHGVTNSRDRSIMIDWWSDDANKRIVQDLDQFFTYDKTPEPFAEHVCMSGRFDMGRTELHRRIGELGYGIHGNVTTTTKFLLVGNKPGTALERAETLGIPIVHSLEALIQAMNDAQSR